MTDVLAEKKNTLVGGFLLGFGGWCGWHLANYLFTVITRIL